MKLETLDPDYTEWSESELEEHLRGLRQARVAPTRKPKAKKLPKTTVDISSVNQDDLAAALAELGLL